LTFPASAATTGVGTPAQWPGVDLTSTYSEGLDVGYRYDHAQGIRPLFPFGFGLAYTTFSLSHLSLSSTNGGFDLRVRVSNTGARAGVAVPQAYVTFPSAAGEPPAQLKAFTTVPLAPGRSREVTLAIPASAFRIYLNGAWTTLPGTYRLAVGQSSENLPLAVSVTAP
jgi:beta-glucosidase